MSFREKSAWISLLSMSIICGYYFWSIDRTAAPTGVFHFGGLVATIIMLIIAQVVLNVGVAILSPKDAKAPLDEREKLIELRSARIAYSGLASGVATACLLGTLNPPIIFNTNGLLFILMTVELLRNVSQIVQYRRSA